MKIVCWEISQGNKFNLVGEQCDCHLWHNGPFEGYGCGLREKGAPTNILNAQTWDEIDVIHQLFVQKTPNAFFGLKEWAWMYTGKVGNAPDFVGLGLNNHIAIAELKWQRGWHTELPDQVRGYAKHGFIIPPGVYTLDVFVAAPQTCTRDVAEQLLSLSQESKEWQSVTIHLGFMQLGWLEERRFIRILWYDGSEWDAGRFVPAVESGPRII